MAENKKSCQDFRYFFSSSSFNLTEIQTEIGDSLSITFVDPPNVPIAIKDVLYETVFYATGNALTHGINVNFSVPSKQVASLPAIRFENFHVIIIMGAAHKLWLNNITFKHCTFQAPVKPFGIDCEAITLDFASTTSLCSSGLAEIVCSSFSIDTVSSGSLTTLIVKFKGTSVPAVDAGNITDDCLVIFGHNWVEVNVDNFSIQFVWPNDERLLGKCTFYGKSRIISDMPLDLATLNVPKWAVCVMDGSVAFSGDWPKKPLEKFNDFLVLDVQQHCELVIESQSVPVSIINAHRTDLALTVNVTIESAAITREIRDFSNITVLSTGNSFECILNQTEVPLKEFNALTKDEYHVKVNGRFGNGSHVLNGLCYYELVDVKIGPRGVLNVSNLYIRSRNLVTIEFTYEDPSNVTPACGFLNLDQVTYQHEKVLLSFMFMPLFGDVPNYKQMDALVKGFAFVRTNESVLRMDFDLPDSGMRWFNKETNILYLEGSRPEGNVSAKILMIPNEYPEFYCIAESEEKCVGQNFITKEELPDLQSRLRKHSTELRLSVYCNLTEEHALHLDVFSPRLIKISSDASSRVQVSVVDQSISGVHFSNLNVDFLHTNVSAVNSQFTGCKILGTTNFSASRNVAIDFYTLEQSGELHFHDLILSLGPEIVTLRLGKDSMFVECTGREWIIQKEVLSGRLTVTTSSPNVRIGPFTSGDPERLFPMDLELTNDCSLTCMDFEEAKIQGGPMSVAHYNYTLRISGAQYFPGVLHGTGNVHFDGNVVLTETQIPSGTCIFYVPTAASIFYMRSCEVHANCEFYVRSEDNKSVEVKISHLFVNASLVTLSLHVFDSMTIADSGKVEGTSLKLSCPVTINSTAIFKLTDLFCKDLTINKRVQVESGTVFVNGNLVINNGYVHAYGSASVSGDVFLAYPGDLLTENLSIHGNVVLSYSMDALPVLGVGHVVQMPASIALKYMYPGHDEDFSAHLSKRYFVVSSTNWICSNTPISFISDDNWYFQDPDPVVSSICNGSMFLTLDRLPQPRPTRHISLVSRDIILIVFLGGCAISAIITITAIFVVRFIRDPHMLEERFAPINTALV